MKLFGRRLGSPIRVSLSGRAFVEGHMVRLDLEAEAKEGDRLKDLLRRLGRKGAVDPSFVRYVLKHTTGVTVLRNGQRLSMPAAAGTLLADGDELSILTPMAGG